jgi:hypothetical protein
LQDALRFPDEAQFSLAGNAEGEFMCDPAWKKLLGPLINAIDALLR